MEAAVSLSEQDVWNALEDVKDPELPVVSVVEMGIVREVEVAGQEVRVRMTPTFSACPALNVMRQGVKARLEDLGFASVSVETVLSPPWSSDWISEGARVKLKDFGIAPPEARGAGNVTFFGPVTCPRCGSEDTAVSASFGPTLCKAIYVCKSCKEPFEAFKSV